MKTIIRPVVSGSFSKITLTSCLLGIGMLVVSVPASAGFAFTPGPPWIALSSVVDNVSDNGDGTWDYGFTVYNNSHGVDVGVQDTPVIVDWEIPYFDDAGIANILSPYGWDYAIETVGQANPGTGWDGVAKWQDPADPWYAGPDSPYTSVTQVLHWYNLCWATGEGGNGTLGCEDNLTGAIFPLGVSEVNSLSGFGFTAEYEPQNGPYQASWALLPVRTGDPQLPVGVTPASPQARGPAAVPEPLGIALIGLGLAGFGLSRRKRMK